MVLDTVLKDNRDRMEMMNMGKVTVMDGIQSVLFFLSVLVEFGKATFSIPLPDGSLALGDTVFSIGATNVSYALLLGLGLFGIQLAQSARMIGRSDDIDIKAYIDQLPTGLSLIVVGTVLLHVMALFSGDVQLFDDIVQGTQSQYWRQIATTTVMTVSYIGVSRENI